MNRNKIRPSIHKDKAFTPIIKAHPFKGNTINIIQKNDVEEKEHAELQIINTYFSGCVRQIYNNKDNKTYTVYHVFPNYTKWYNKKMKEINNILYLEVPNSKITIECGPHHLTLMNSVEHNGMFFEGNIDNIDKLKKLNVLLRDFKKILKVNSTDDILSTVKESKEITEDDGTIRTIPHLNFKKYFKLKQDK